MLVHFLRSNQLSLFLRERIGLRRVRTLTTAAFDARLPSIDIWQSMQPIYLFFLAVAVLLLVLKRCNGNNRSNSIPSPFANWLTGFKIGLPTRSQDVMRRWALEHGELFQIRIGWYNWVVVNSPQAMKEIFDKQVSAQNFCPEGSVDSSISVFIDIFQSTRSDWT